MKKTLLSIGIAFLFCVGAMAQKIVMPWNAYAATTIEYQGKDASKLADYTPKVNDVITVHIAGTATEDISNLQLAVIDDRADVEYWAEFSGFIAVGNIAKGETFDKEIDLKIISLESAKGISLSDPKLVFDGKNADLEGGAGVSITLNLTTYEVSIFSPIAGATVFTANEDGKKQSTPFVGEVSEVKVGDKLSITISGKADVDASEFQVVLVDGTAEAAYWKELSEFITFDPADVAAGQAFNLTAELEVTALPVGIGSNSLQLIFTTVADAKIVQIENFNLSVEKVGNSSVSTVEASSVKVISIEGGLSIVGAEKATIYGIDGRIVATAAGEIVLPKGVYIVKVGAETVKAIVK